MIFTRASNVSAVAVMQVIRVESVIGNGSANSPVRKLIEYYSMEGELLARIDTLEDEVTAVAHASTPILGTGGL